MSSSRESRLRRVIKRPGDVCPTLPHVTEGPETASLVLHEAGATKLEAEAEARRAAFEEGRRAGLEEAMTSIAMRRAASLEQVCNRLAGAAEKVAQDRAAVLEEVVGDVAALAAELVETLVGAVEWPETPAHAALAKALALAPEGPELVARVHPDAGLAEEDVTKLTARTGLRLVRDHTVDPAGCVVEVGSCTIDAQLSSALARVRRQFEGMKVSMALQAVVP